VSVGCGDVDGVRPTVEAAIYEADVPAGYFSYVVAAFAGAAAVFQDGWPAVSMADDVINVPYRRITVGTLHV
jgi:hypothetical protein